MLSVFSDVDCGSQIHLQIIVFFYYNLVPRPGKMSLKLDQLIKPFEGQGDLEQWLKKFSMVCKMMKWTDEVEYLPLMLTGEAFVVFDQMPEDDKSDVEKVKRRLRKAFCLQPSQAYLQFTSRKYIQGESVDFFLSDLQRLIILSGVESKYQEVVEPLVKQQFLLGLPVNVSANLQSVLSASGDEKKMAEIVELARVMLAQSDGEYPVCSGSIDRRSNRPNVQMPKANIQCYECKNYGHVRRNCAVYQSRMQSGSGNANGGQGAPQPCPPNQ